MSNSDSKDFGGTLTGGIQDISALLPLLGTEQCERHVGSALTKGFLYSSVTPLSIFGSLGIVRATFNILVASISIEKLRFLGAAKLSDGGFLPNGDVAPMLALDPEHPKRFTVESRLEAMLKEESVENVVDLTVSWADDVIRWNILLFASTLIVASAGLLPYLPIVLGSDSATSQKLFPLGFGFPILRVVGSALCVTLSQFLIQIRILLLLKTRLLFRSIDRLAKEKYIDIGLEINKGLGRDWRWSSWDSELASERCLWALRTYIGTRHADPESTGSDPSRKIQEIYDEQYERQMDPIDGRLPRWVTLILICGLVLGGCSTVVGYIGCFYLIQHSVKSNGPLLWLLLEALLSVFRILVWAINPSWDDSKGIVWKLPSRLLVTCDISEVDFQRDGVAPLMPSSEFEQSVRMYTGLHVHPGFVVPADIEVYYIRVANGDRASEEAHGRLYIVLCDRRDPQTGLLLFKEVTDDIFLFARACSLERPLGSTFISVKVDWSEEDTSFATHSLASNPMFMALLGQHYDDIVSKIRTQQAKRERTFDRTWNMRRFTKDDLIDLPEDSHGDNTRRYIKRSPLTVEAGPYAAYILQGQIERRSHELYQQLEEWIELFMTLHTKELLPDVPPDLSLRDYRVASFVKASEANETEFLLAECQSILELLLAWTIGKWDQYAKKNHDEMVAAVLKGSFESMGVSGHEPGAAGGRQRQGDDFRMTEATARLDDKFYKLRAREARTYEENLQIRLAAQLRSVKQRMQIRVGRGGYTGRSRDEEAIEKVWDDMSNDVHSVHSPPPPSTDALRDVIGKRRTDYIATQNTRYQKVLEEWQAERDVTSRTVDKLYGILYARSQQRIAMVFLRLEHQIVEFEDLHTPDILIKHEHELVKYWSTPSLQERIRFISQAHRYLRLGMKAIELVGGPQNMLRALKRSQDFPYIDFMVTGDALGPKDIAAIVESVESVTGLCLPEGFAHPNGISSPPSNALHFLSRRSDGLTLLTPPNVSADPAPMADSPRISQNLSRATHEIHETLRSVESPTHTKVIHESIAKRRRDILQNTYDAYFYTDVQVADEHRQGQPYLLFDKPGKSRCDIYFVTKQKSNYFVIIRHYILSKDGHVAEVVIRLNRHDITESCRWGQTAAVHSNFENEHLLLPCEHLVEVGQRNQLEIILKDDSPADSYLLSDVSLPVFPVRPLRLETIPEDTDSEIRIDPRLNYLLTDSESEISIDSF